MTPPTQWHTSAHTDTSTRIQVNPKGSKRYVGTLVQALGVWNLVARRLRKGVDWARDTVNSAGWYALAVAIIALGLGLSFGWIEAVFVAIVAIVLVLLAIPFLFGAAEYRVQLSLEDDRVVAGSLVRGELEVQNIATRIALPSRMDIPIGEGLVDLPLPFLIPNQTWKQSLEIPALKRGIIDVGPVTTIKGDPIGLLSQEKTWAGVQQIYVHPVTAALPSISVGFIRDLEGNPTRRIVDSDISFHAIREYSTGDARRHIHWKSTAKTGQLMVRQFEETKRARMTVVLSSNSDDYKDEDEYELAVSAAASLGVRAIRDGREVEVITSLAVPELVKASLSTLRRLSVRSHRTLLDDFSGVELLENTSSVEDVCRLAAQGENGVSLAFIVCGSQVSLRRLRTASRMFPINSSVIALMCDEYAEPGIRTVGNLSVAHIALLDDVKQLLTRVVVAA